MPAEMPRCGDGGRILFRRPADAAPATVDAAARRCLFRRLQRHRRGGNRPARRPPFDGPQSPQLTIEKTCPREVQVGKPATFHVTVREHGPRRSPATSKSAGWNSSRHAFARNGEPPAARGPRGELVWTWAHCGPGEDGLGADRLVPTAEGEESAASGHRPFRRRRLRADHGHPAEAGGRDRRGHPRAGRQPGEPGHHHVESRQRHGQRHGIKAHLPPGVASVRAAATWNTRWAICVQARAGGSTCN